MLPLSTGTDLFANFGVPYGSPGRTSSHWTLVPTIMAFDFSDSSGFDIVVKKPVCVQLSTMTGFGFADKSVFEIAVEELICVWLSTIVDLAASKGSILAVVMTAEEERIAGDGQGVEADGLDGSILATVTTAEKERIAGDTEGVHDEELGASMALRMDIHKFEVAILMLLPSEADTCGQNFW